MVVSEERSGKNNTTAAPGVLAWPKLIVVMNGSQRCEMHNLALFWWVGWARSACRVAVAILVKSDSARNF